VTAQTRTVADDAVDGPDRSRRPHSASERSHNAVAVHHCPAPPSLAALAAQRLEAERVEAESDAAFDELVLELLAPFVAGAPAPPSSAPRARFAALEHDADLEWLAGSRPPVEDADRRGLWTWFHGVGRRGPARKERPTVCAVDGCDALPARRHLRCSWHSRHGDTPRPAAKRDAFGLRAAAELDDALVLHRGLDTDGVRLSDAGDDVDELAVADPGFTLLCVDDAGRRTYCDAARLEAERARYVQRAW
jgi:hypothetical protein